MFKDKYSKDVEKIKFEGTLKRYIKAKMLQEKRSNKTPIRFVGVLAGLVCVCVVASLLSTPKNPSSVVDPIVQKTDKVLMSNVKYSEIYDAITLSHEEQDYNLYGDNEVIIDEGATTGTASVPESTNKDDGVTNDNVQSDKPDHSTTNNQVVGVDETDIVKTDGEYIYVCKQTAIKIAKAKDGELELVSSIELDEYDYPHGIFVSGNRLVVLLSNYKEVGDTHIRVYDITDKAEPKDLGEKTQSGSYFNSRMQGGKIYLLTRYYVGYDINKDNPETYVPLIDGATVGESSITYINNFTNSVYLVVSAFDINTADFVSSEAFLGGAENVYCDSDSLYFTFTKYEKNENKTYIVKVNLSANQLKIQAMGEVKGRPLNQFSMDEYEGNLRIVTTVEKTITAENKTETPVSSNMVSSTSQDIIFTDDVIDTNIIETVTTNSLYVLDKNLKVIGKIEDLAKGEQVYSVRFDGNTGYFVTFKQIDPLFTVDLSNPANPTILSELKIPGFSEYMHPFGEDRLFGFGRNATEQGLVTGLKLSMFNVSDKSNVTEEAKEIIDSAFSEASGNHKAIMVDKNKNIIAFAVMDYYGSAKVYVYGYDEENGFFIQKTKKIGKADLHSARFVWIGDYFYLVHSEGIVSFTLDGFKEVSKLQF